MNCSTHTELASEAFCTQCGRALCHDCIRKVVNSVHCETCLEAALGSKTKTVPSMGGSNPEAAFILGLIPGVGAIYNGEYFKGAIHVLVFATLTQLDAALITVAFYFYMPFEAFYTAKKRKLAASGVQIETPIDRFHEQTHAYLGGIRNKEAWGGIGLIVLGVLYLLDNFGLISLRGATRFWPLLLIAAGVVLLLRSKEKISQ